MRSYISRHVQVFISTIGAMLRAPWSTLNVVLIFAIMLVLPCLLCVSIKSAQTLSNDWQGQPQVSVFLQQNISEQQAALIYSELQLHPSVALAELISPKRALEEFKKLSGLEAEIDFLGHNPLPASVVLMPDKQSASSEALLTLKQELEKIDGIESIRLDLDWTNRFNAIVKSAAKIAVLLSALFGLALILIVGNTIKLLIFNRRHEIEVTKLVGGNNAFVRRPFLYFGSLYGFCGALLALVLLFTTAKTLQPSLTNLANLYQKETLIYTLNAQEIAIILLAGTLIGWLAARWSVARHLSAVKPK